MKKIILSLDGNDRLLVAASCETEHDEDFYVYGEAIKTQITTWEITIEE